MDKLKYGLIGVGVVGIIGVFVFPLITFGGRSLTLWDMKEAKATAAYIPMLGFLIVAGMGGLGTVKGKLEKWMAGAASGGASLAAVWMFKDKLWKNPPFNGIGGKLLIAAAVAGIIIAAIAAKKSDD